MRFLDRIHETHFIEKETSGGIFIVWEATRKNSNNHQTRKD